MATRDNGDVTIGGRPEFVIFPPNIGKIGPDADPKKLLPFVSFTATRYVDLFPLTDEGAKSSRSSDDTTTQSQILCNIYLPLPADVSNVILPGWEVQNSIVTSAAADLAAKLRSGGFNMGDLKNTATNIAAAATVGTSTLGRLTALAANPKKQALFAGIETREFSFNYILTPQSEKEAGDIQLIVKLFNKFSLPSRSNVGGTDAFLNFPSEWNISFNRVQGFPKIKRCVCTNVSVVWAPGSMQLLKSGHAIQVGLSLAFKETSIRTEEDIGLE